MSRAFSVSLTEAIETRDFLTERQERQGDTIGYSTSAADGRASSATLAEDSRLRIRMEGQASRGETDSMKVCRVLMSRLNQDGQRWMDVREPTHASVDGTLVDGNVPPLELPVQVVRAIATPEPYRLLRRVRAYDETRTINAALAELRQAIEHKTPCYGRADPAVVLAIDATQLAGLAFDAVVRQFRSQYAGWAAGTGYRAVWLVGPEPRLTWRLDVVNAGDAHGVG